MNNIVFGKVYLPNHNKPLYVVASWLPGEDEPLILLTNLVVETLDQARNILWFYEKRWVCEEAVACSPKTVPVLIREYPIKEVSFMKGCSDEA